MIDKIISSVKQEMGSKLVSLGLPESKTDGAVKLAGETVQKHLKEEVAGGNISTLTNLFKGGESMEQNGFVQKMIGDYGSKMISQLGVSESISKSISSYAIPFIMGKVGNKVEGQGESGLMDLIGGGGALGKLKSLGGLFK